MPRRFIAFDIETAKLLPDEATDILQYRPLGISCAAACASDGTVSRTWAGKKSDGSVAGQLSAQEARGLVEDLQGYVRQGYTLVTWNGLHFDFNVLAEEADAWAQCAELAKNHVDMMFHVVCARGHFLGLQAACEGMGLGGKTEGVSGAEAPQMWADGRHEEVLAYCARDVEVTAKLAAAGDAAKRLTWITQKGREASFRLPEGWLAAHAATALPEPDTSWMSNPPKREDFMSWMARTAG